MQTLKIWFINISLYGNNLFFNHVIKNGYLYIFNILNGKFLNLVFVQNFNNNSTSSNVFFLNISLRNDLRDSKLSPNAYISSYYK